jgi:hypothetical protein
MRNQAPRPKSVVALLLVAAGLLAAGLCPSASVAAQPSLPAPVTDCNSHGRLTHAYSAQQLRYALNHMPSDIKEYTDCADVIRNALLADIHPHGGAVSSSSSSGGGFLSTGVIIALIVVVVGGGGFVAVASRRRR